MRLITYDCEVFAHDWLVVLKDIETGRFTAIHNDNEELKQCMTDDCVYVGFNSKHYDQFIIKAICCGFSPQEVKQVNDFIIGGGQGWECPMLRDQYFRFPNVDIKDDMQMGLSLKAIEGHLGLSVKESTVPFDLDRPLTEEELKETLTYCMHDVDTTEKLVELRRDYLKNKVHIGKLAGLDDVRAMGMTNAKLTAALLKASKQPHDDERKYVYPEKLKREYIPQEIFDFFDKMYDPEVSDKELFSGKQEFQIGDCPGVVGYGGIHAAIPNYFFEETESRVIRNKDVASYYPHLMTLCGYTSRNIPSAETFENVLETRMKAKASGDKATANALKLVVNTTYGALLNQYNDLYDPLMGRSVCITGQLFLMELAQHLYRDIPGLKIVQLNTDGVMAECDVADLDKLNEICDE
ncbi:MAG: DNA polymerase elongation subunit (family B), partial [Oscillospiraceae bacterium]|nr:DNA polymerase elongation subunit (family B) [Oscillospiraceae bacterium]